MDKNIYTLEPLGRLVNVQGSALCMPAFVKLSLGSSTVLELPLLRLSQIIQSQPAAKQASMATWFKNLMEGIDRNLLTKNRDR